MRVAVTLFLVFSFSVGAFAQKQLREALRLIKKHEFQEVDFEDMMRRYFHKETTHPVEGIYSVSCVIIKKSSGIFSNEEKERIVERKDNYARVAIMKDWPGTKRDFVEVSLSYRDVKKYPIVGHMNALSEGNGFIYNHIEPDGDLISFSMIGESSDLLEGEYSKVQGRKTITYKLSYIKIFPKNEAIVTSDE
jgi:hypothetical protein